MNNNVTLGRNEIQSIIIEPLWPLSQREGQGPQMLLY
jgi:hypothetical protein